MGICSFSTFQQRDIQDSQNLKFDTFWRVPVTSAHCVIGTESYPDAGKLLNYDDDDYIQEYAQINGAFRALGKDDNLQPNRSDDDFRSSNVSVVKNGCNIYVFDIRYQQNFAFFQPIKVELKFDEVPPNDIKGYALVLTNEFLSVSSDGQRHFDLNKVIILNFFHNTSIFFHCRLRFIQ